MATEQFGVFKNGALVFMSEIEEHALTKFRVLAGDNLLRIRDLKHLQATLNTLSNEQTRLNMDSRRAEECTEDAPVSTALDSVIDKLKELGFTEENREAAAEKIKDGSRRLITEVRSLGIRGAETLRDQLKEFSTVIDESLLQALKDEELQALKDEELQALKDEEQADVDSPNVSDEPEGELPYGRNGT